MANADGLRRAVETRAGFIARRLAIDVDQELSRSALKHGHKDSGQMLAKIEVTSSRSSPTTWRVVADVPVKQAYWTDRGKAMVIRAKRAKALRWVDRSTGEVIFAKSVRRPAGTRWFSSVMNPIAIRGILSRFVGR